MKPLFSVIIPTYNSASKITRAVQSVLAQTFKDYEIWVIDDGSTDETRSVLEPFGEQIHYHYQANQGVAGARNQGAQYASGTYLAFLDADDWWYPQKLERVAQAISTAPEVGLFYSQVDFFNESGTKLWTYRSEDRGRRNYHTLLQRDFVLTSSAVAKTDCLTQMGRFDGAVSPCEDWDMWLRIAWRFPICLIPEPLSAYEYQASSSLTSGTQHWVQAHDRLLDKILATDPDMTPFLRRRIRSAIAYRKGKIYLAAREDASALHAFQEALRIRPLFWQSWLYWGVLRSRLLRKLLPQRIKYAMRLPEAQP